MPKKKEMCSSVSIEPDKGIVMMSISELHDFKGHPFKVERNPELFELRQSIEKEGILIPLLIRKNPNGDGYEIIAGHRRKEAAIWAGITELPVIIRELDDDQATIAMVDSNLQREKILPSEKAFAYKMKLEAMKQQGRRNDLTSGQVEPKLENETLEIYPLESEIDENGRVIIKQKSGKKGIRSNELLARQVGGECQSDQAVYQVDTFNPKDFGYGGSRKAGTDFRSGDFFSDGRGTVRITCSHGNRTEYSKSVSGKSAETYEPAESSGYGQYL